MAIPTFFCHINHLQVLCLKFEEFMFLFIIQNLPSNIIIVKTNFVLYVIMKRLLYLNVRRKETHGVSRGPEKAKLNYWRWKLYDSDIAGQTLLLFKVICIQYTTEIFTEVPIVLKIYFICK